ncbi:UDP-N-acetylglucosamine 1-carboxyvinyltransferase, partial [Klebsiella pneumoniae]|nr:UDP-N-acetylglucosamine 1-carboxyvinyltransferase [Klebsiella pneumoniae]
FMAAAAITEGDVYIEDAISEHNQPLISKLKELGATITEDVSGVRVQGSTVLHQTKARTLPYPGFPTDIQSPFTVAQVLAEGTSEMEETVFENRFMHLEELRRMNANFNINGNTAIMNGPAKLQGAAVA